jgi:hypothetical protein
VIASHAQIAKSKGLAISLRNQTMNVPLGFTLKDFTILPDETRPMHIYCARTDQTFHVDPETYAEVEEAVKNSQDVDFSTLRMPEKTSEESSEKKDARE